MRSALHGYGVRGFVDLCEAGRTDLAVLCGAQGWGLEERNICAVFARLYKLEFGRSSLAFCGHIV